MLAYHPYWLQALVISREAKRLLGSNWITPEQYKIIKAAFTTPLYTPNVFERIALFISTFICIAGVFLFTTEFLDERGVHINYVPGLTIGVFCITALELLIKFKRTYQAGIDDALLYAGLILTIGGIFNLLDTNFPSLPLAVHYVIAFPLLLFAAIRYVDRLCSIVAFVSFVCIIFVLLGQQYPTGKTLLPLSILLLSSGAYFYFRRSKKKTGLAPWRDCFSMLEVASLCTFYLAGNYYVVQMFIDAEFRVALFPGQALKAEFIYYVFTSLLPIGYIVFGLINRDRLLLRVGLFVEGLSFLTLRYYFHTIALEHALVILGCSFILIAIVAIQSLKTAHKGFTHHKPLPRLPEYVAPEALIMFDRLATQREAVKAFDAGDGHFGGGTTLGW